MSCGNNIVYFRKKLNITQEELAERLDVSRQTVSKWENDIAFPETEKLVEVCNLFDCSIDLLLRGDAKKQDTEEPTKKFAERTEKSEVIEPDKAEKSTTKADEGKEKKFSFSDSVCGIIMLFCTALFLFISVVFNAWHPAWVIFPIGGVICGIVSKILDIKKHRNEK